MSTKCSDGDERGSLGPVLVIHRALPTCRRGQVTVGRRESVHSPVQLLHHGLARVAHFRRAREDPDARCDVLEVLGRDGAHPVCFLVGDCLPLRYTGWGMFDQVLGVDLSSPSSQTDSYCG